MTDQILIMIVLAVIGVCVTYAFSLRLRRLNAGRRPQRGAFAGVNRFRSTVGVEDLSSLN